MTTPTAVEPLTPELSASLADFARTCKAAARAVSLYPEVHPAIQSSLARVVASSERLASGGDLALTVLPDALLIDGRASARQDASIGELAALLHERLVAALVVRRSASPQDWRALLLLLSRPPEELIAEGGISKAWTATGREHVEILEIDYADVLRERDGGETVDWDQIIASCVQGKPLDESQLALLLETFSDPALLDEFLARLQGTEGTGGPSMSDRAAALLSILGQLLESTTDTRDADRLLQTVADGTSRMVPDMLLALLERARTHPDKRPVMTSVLSRITDDTVASFVANAVVTEGGASDRLAQAFQALVPEPDNRDRILDLARGEITTTPLGSQSGFEELWQSAANMLTSYSDQTYVSSEYGRQLTSARTRAIEVERLSDDPPERVLEWKASVSDAAVRQLDLSLLVDLLRIEEAADPWSDVAAVAVGEVRRRVSAGDLAGARQLVDTIAGVAAEPAPGRGPVAAEAIGSLGDEGFVRHVLAQVRTAPSSDEATAEARALYTAIGPRLADPLADALAAEDQPRIVRMLADVLVSFGPASRDSLERLRGSSNAAVRRVVIELLRTAHGNDSLPELQALLHDTDAHVQRESMRAMLQIGTPEAMATLERELMAALSAGTPMLQQLISLRENRAAPLLCHALVHSEPKGRMAETHLQIIEALGGLKGHAESAVALKRALYRGEWWAPRKTSTLRQAAAAALRRLNSPEALAVLTEASTHGSPGVRRVAKTHAASGMGRSVA